MIFLGIDPGESGGIAAVHNDGQLLYASKFHGLSVAELVVVFENPWGAMPVSMATIELVHSMPKQGVSSSHKFGRSAGMLEGIIAALKIPYQLVSPQKWQKAMGCLTRGDKNVSKAKAQQLYPGTKITHATADAILLARYGWATYPRAVASATPAAAAAPSRPDLPL